MSFIFEANFKGNINRHTAIEMSNLWRLNSVVGRLGYGSLQYPYTCMHNLLGGVSGGRPLGGWNLNKLRAAHRDRTSRYRRYRLTVTVPVPLRLSSTTKTDGRRTVVNRPFPS